MIDERSRLLYAREEADRGRGHCRVVHFSSVHQALDFRIMRECVALAQAGYAVTNIAIYDRDTVVDGVRIVPVAKPRSRKERVLKTIPEVLRLARAQDADIYHFHDPELIFAGLSLQRAGKTVIYDAHEDVPNQVMSKEWLPKPLRPLVSKAMDTITRQTSRKFSGIVGTTPHVLMRFSNERTALVRNYAVSDEFRIDPSEFIPFSQRRNLVFYCGSLMPTRGVREMMEAMRQPNIPADAVLQIAGAFDDAAMERDVRAAEQTGRVQYVGWADRQKYRELLTTAKVGLSLAHPTPAYLEGISTKIYDYMSAGVPVVISDFPIWREVIDRYGCGIAVDPLDPSKVADAIAWLLEHPQEAEAMGRRGRSAIDEDCNWEREAREMLKLYATLEASLPNR